MMKRMFAAAIVLASAAMISAQRPGAVTTVEYGGAEIVLHPDSTWSFKKAAKLSASESDDVFVPVGSRYLWLKPDETYTFVKTPPKANRPSTFPAINVASSVTRVDYDAAENLAVSDVYNKAALQLHKFIPSNYKDKKKAQEYVLACLKDNFKKNEIEMVHGQDKNRNWKVDTKISIPDYRSKLIVECLDLQLQPDETAAPPAEKK